MLPPLPPTPLLSHTCVGACVDGDVHFFGTQRHAVNGGGSGLVVHTMPTATYDAWGGIGIHTYKCCFPRNCDPRKAPIRGLRAIMIHHIYMQGGKNNKNSGDG
eukprot:GEMP01069063.1.p2 GENE.GEMP01069063.1~~GEMP01069063.1.p2  ORF type:complete len:103 (-),score=27.37 GEMP01069063.1:295-603(-)